MKFTEIEDNEEEYQERMDEMTPEGHSLGEVILPSENTNEDQLDVFHELMMDHGYAGIEYMQESLHRLGRDWMVAISSTPEDVMEDFEIYKEEE